MATSPTNKNFASSYNPPTYNPQALCCIVGLACLAGFLVDLAVLSFPPSLGNLEWRIGFIQQVSDRSVILLFGLALLLYGTLDFRTWRKPLSLLCTVLGVAFSLASILAIADGVAFQRQAVTAISSQAAQIESQIQKAQSDAAVAPDITPEQLEQAAQQLRTQANALKSNAKTSVIKTGVASVGNLLVVGLALVGLGRYGARPPRA